MLAVQLLLKFQKITQDNMRENSFFSSEFLNKQNRIINGKVNTYADLPAPANYNGEIWLVKTTTGVIFVNKKVAGLYVSNGTAWNIITPVEIDGYQKLITTPTNDNIAITDANGQTKDGGKKISDLEQIVNKDATGGYVGLTLFKINFKNVANTFTSFFTNSNTASRTYTLPDVNGTVITTGDTGTITSLMIADGAILNTDINATANISATKLQQTTIAPTKVQPANNDTLDVLANKLLGLANTRSSLAPLTIANLASGGVIGTAVATVDVNSVFLINQTTAGQTITFPTPTVATLSQIITIKANSTASLIAYGNTISAGGSNSFLWNGSVWSSIGSSGSSLSYMTGFNVDTYSANLGVGDHIKFSNVYTFGGSDITLDGSTAYTTTLNVASVGRITLKAGKTYSLWGSINNAISPSYGAYKWVNSDSGAILSLVSGGAAPSSVLNRHPGVGAFCFFTPSVDTRVELQLTYGGLTSVNGTGDAIGPAQFHIQTL
jgi:hypothetical protein